MKKIFFTLFISCVFAGVVKPQTYVVEDVITGLNKPIAFDFMPNGNIIFTQQQGKVRIFTRGNQEVSLFWDFTDSCFSSGELGTLGITLDPDFTTNHYVYVFFVKGPPGTTYTPRIYRFIEDNNNGKSPLKIFEFVEKQGSNIHVSGNLHFRGDGKLYFSFGDYVGTGQYLNHSRGKIHRINGNGTAPTDNPFYDDGNPATGNDDRIWAYGLRNSFDFCFSPINDSLYATENTSVGQDEINQIIKGKNYGYPTCQLYCNNPAFVNPIGLSGSNDRATTAILIYNGTQMPELNGKLLYASCWSDKIFQCTLGRPPMYDTILNTTEFLNIGTNGCIPTMKQGADDFIYASLLDQGKIIRIRHIPLGINNQNIPVGYLLEQNYPNPFNPVTKINYDLPKNSKVNLVIYDILGREVIRLVNNELKQAGRYVVEFNGQNYASGVYFYRIDVGDFVQSKKMVLVK